MKLTLKQLAELAGVHRSTIDKVLHNREGVSDEVRARVQKIIDEVGYQPNVIGKALALQKNPLIIAVLLLKVDAVTEIRQGIDAAFNEFKNYGLQVEYFICSDNDITEQLHTLSLMEKKKISGIIISPIQEQAITKAINAMVDNGIPVVTVNTDLPESKRLCFIGQDAVQAGRTAGELMSEILGCKGQVAIITGSDQMQCTADRQKGFEKVIAERYPDIKIVEIIATFENPLVAFQKTLALIETVPSLDGVYVTCGNVSEVGRAVRIANREKDLKIICFDLYPNVVELVRSGVINFTIGQNLFFQGYQSLKVIFNRLFHNQMPEADFIRTPIDIRLRENLD